MEEIKLQRFEDMISRQTGLSIREQDRKKLDEVLHSRMRFLGSGSLEDYYGLLQESSEESHIEWQELIIGLTTGETYFFRDKGQFSLLKSWILPEILNRQKTERNLRIWSAGCSTGEEPYSLAMLVDELLPDKSGWDIFILGTDINKEAIEKAKQGVYGQWSFRGAGKDFQNRYFQKSGSQWKLDERIKNIVIFRTGNLISDPYPNEEIHDMDLILCRNVFIYFNRAIVSPVVEKISKSLREGGYLMTGHAELNPEELERLKPKMFPESVIYQCIQKRPEKPWVKSVPMASISLPEKVTIPKTVSPLPPLAKPEKKPTLPSFMDEALILFQAGKYSASIEMLNELLKDEPRRFDAHYLMAHAFANRGEYEKAAEHCQKAIEIDSFRADPYFLLAQLTHEKGEREEEIKLLKKVIYLAPSHVAAFIELGNIYDHEGDAAKAQKMRSSALEILKTFPLDARIEPYVDFTAAELFEHLQALLPRREKKGVSHGG